MIDDVVELIENRRKSGSQPGRRADRARIGLCIEGGAMRGVVSAAMVAALEQLGALRAFDVVIGASAGAANGAYFVAGHAAFGSTIYYENINTRSFIDPARLLVGRPVVNLDFLVDDVMARAKRLDAGAVVRSAVPLVIVASDVDAGQSDTLDEFADEGDVLACIRASATMPILAGPPCSHRGRRYWDGSMTEPVPVDTAARLGCTHVLALLTRPAGVGRPPLSWFERRVILPRIRRISPPIAERFARQDEDYKRVMARIESTSHAPLVRALRPSGRPVGNLERRRNVLVAGAREGFDAVMSAFARAPAAALP